MTNPECCREDVLSQANLEVSLALDSSAKNLLDFSIEFGLL